MPLEQRRYFFIPLFVGLFVAWENETEHLVCDGQNTVGKLFPLKLLVFIQ